MALYGELPPAPFSSARSWGVFVTRTGDSRRTVVGPAPLSAPRLVALGLLLSVCGKLGLAIPPIYLCGVA
jgi:hypothetical protein